VLEAHRLNSDYILSAKSDGSNEPFIETLKRELDIHENRPIDLKLLTKTLLKYDVNALLHGIFLAQKEIAGGRMRIPRALTAFIEARGVTTATSGGVKNDRLNPKGDTSENRGNVIFHREEFCGEMTAYFTLDLALIRGFGLGDAVEQLLIGLALFKIGRFLRDGLRLRTACDLELDGGLQVKRPAGFKLPLLDEVEKGLPELIKSASDNFTKPARTTVKFEE
jgi:CRISPR-associated protein Csb1